MRQKIPWFEFGKPVFVFVFENCFREQKQKSVFYCFFFKIVSGKLFSKTENSGETWFVVLKT
jgi:hypothetical protein